MKFGILVDGEAEVASLPRLIPQLREHTGHTILHPLRSAVQPKATAERIAQSCQREITILAGKGVDRVIVLIDREDRAECPTELALQVQRAIAKRTAVPVRVVVKDRCFEN